MRHALATLAVLAILCVIPSPAFAWMREPFEDADVVARSELIVVAHLEPGSIRRVDHVKAAHEGRSWEHHATLVITSTLKGKADATKIPIIIHYGLDPDLQDPARGVPLYDNGNSACCGPPIVADATTDNIWLLRRRAGIYGRDPGHGDHGIVDPEDVRPLADKDYLALYLGLDAETTVPAYAAKHPRVASAVRFAEHVEIKRILAIADASARVDKLIPYFLHHARWAWLDEAQDGLVAAGADVAGPRLVKAYAGADRGARSEIVAIWGRLKFRGAVDQLVDSLVDNDKFWAAQKLSGDWWNASPESVITSTRRDHYGEVYGAVIALGEIGDRKARPAIAATLARWTAIQFSNPQIVEACQAALANLPR